jgi:hypothetical protein
MDVRVAKTLSAPAETHCETCGDAVSMDEKVRHMGSCFTCATEAETGTLFLNEPPTSIH